ncbi:MAG: hypothetical protein GWO27_19360, partial [Thermoplasmata archaeon]|nr:hypothetical protein [Thermoplasmata archaeon]
MEDLYGNVVETGSRAVHVVDDDAPEMLMDETPGSGQTGEDLTFRMRIIDNVGVEEVQLEVRIGDGT